MDDKQRIELLEYRLNILGGVVEHLLNMYQAYNPHASDAVGALFEAWNNQEDEAKKKINL